MRYPLVAAISLSACLALSGCISNNLNLVGNPAESLERASDAFKQGNYSKAQDEATRAASDRTYRPLALVILAQCQSAQGHFTEAEPLARRAVDLAPSMANAHAALAQALIGLAEYDEGLSQAEQALGLSESPNLPSSRSEQHRSRAIGLEQESHLAEADNEYKQALDADLNNALAARDYGILLNDRGNYREAIAKLTHAQDLLPQDPAIYFALITAEINTNKLTEAAACANKLAELTPNDPKAKEAQAKVLLKQGRTADAIAKCREILNVQSKFGPAYIILADGLLRENNVREAQLAAQKASDLEPGNPLTSLVQAKILAAQKDWIAADQALLMVKQLAPDNVALNNEVDSLARAYTANLSHKVKPKAGPP